MIKFINDKRKSGRSTTEGFGADAYVSYEYEIKCSCGKWTDQYGDVSQQVGDDPNVHVWICPTCVSELEQQ